jgi:hypothetical protein
MSRRQYQTPVLLRIPADSKETFCHDCGQLRLCLTTNNPTNCGNCQSSNILVGSLNSSELTEARAKWKPT